MLPSIAPKRNLASLAKAGRLGKRNIATLARDRVLPKNSIKFNAEKRELDIGKLHRGTIFVQKGGQFFRGFSIF
jgi:hypothetical protein